MKSCCGGRLRLAPCFTASLLIHLAVIVSVIAVTCREKAVEQGVMRLSVEFVELPAVRAPSPGAVVQGTEKQHGSRYAVQPGPLPTAPAKTRPEQKDRGSNVLPSTPPPTPQEARIGREEGPSPVKTVLPASRSTTQLSVGAGGSKPGGGTLGTGSATGAGPRGEGGTAGRGATPATVGGDQSSQLAGYQALLKRIIEAHKDYPLAARKTGRQGSCQRRFTIGRGGSLKKVELLSSCGHPFLDDAATRAITAVRVFPPLPAGFKGGEATFTVTITFTLANE